MELYVGLDLHSTNTYVVIMDEDGKGIYDRRVNNETDLLLETLEPYRTQIKGVVVESTYNWYWLVDRLQAENYCVHLAHPCAAIAYKGLKHTDDQHDARWLAEQLRLGILPEGHIYPKEKRGLREVMRKRAKIMRQHTQTLLSIQGTILRYSGKKISGKKMKQLTEEALKKYISDAQIQVAITSQLKLLATKAEIIYQLDQHILKKLKKTKNNRLLQSVPGIGKLLSCLIELETGDIKRFSSARHYSSYCRCVPSKKLSNGKKKGSNNRRNGNAYLCWAFIQATHFAIRYSPEIKKYYQRQIRKKKRVIVIKSIAHKLAKAVYYLLTEQERFDMNKAFG